jgi:hypothetical protein
VPYLGKPNFLIANGDNREMTFCKRSVMATSKAYGCRRIVFSFWTIRRFSSL